VKPSGIAKPDFRIDVPINDNGREQSHKAAELLKDVPLDFAVSSPMLRPKKS